MATAELVFAQHCVGEVSSLAGYLRGMVEIAGPGEMHLEPRFH